MTGGHRPADVLARGRGLLRVDRDAAPDLRRTVLRTPGLDRCVAGVLVAPALLGEGPVARGCAVGVDLDAQAVPIGLRDPAAYLAQRMAHWTAAGVTLSRWTATVPEAPAEQGPQLRLAASWARACGDAGVVPVLCSRLSVPPHAPLGTARELRRETTARLLDALRRRGVEPADLLLEIDPVLPGGRHAGVASPDDAALATVGALREAGAAGLGGVLLRAPVRPADLPAHLDAAQRAGRELRWGFTVEASRLLPGPARRGAVVRVHDEVRARMDGLVRVLRASAST